MRSLSGLGIGLSLLFGFLFLALVAEVYYLLWWKKKIVNRGVGDEYTSSAREFLDLFCWKKPSSLGSTAFNPREICTSARIVDGSDDAHLIVDSSNKDSVVKTFGGEEGIDVELMRLHNLSGPPRLLFTIKEETKEDLESEDGRTRRRTLSDFLLTMESPFLSPLSSPPIFTHHLTPLESYSKHGFNPLFESSAKEEDKKLVWPSPPPKFKFLRDAEEKLYRKTLMEEAMKVQIVNGGLSPGNAVRRSPPPLLQSPGSASPVCSLEKDGSFITITVGMSQDNEKIQQKISGSSPQPQAFPLHSSPRKPIFSWSSKE